MIGLCRSTMTLTFERSERCGASHVGPIPCHPDATRNALRLIQIDSYIPHRDILIRRDIRFLPSQQVSLLIAIASYKEWLETSLQFHKLARKIFLVDNARNRLPSLPAAHETTCRHQRQQSYPHQRNIDLHVDIATAVQT